MFRLLRLFFITSAVAAAAIILAAVLYRQSEVNRLIAFAETQNLAPARSFANTIWHHFSSYVVSAPETDADALRSRPETAEIHEALKQMSAGLPVLKIKIYDLDGLTVYSSDTSEIGEDKSANLGFFAAAHQGKAASKLASRHRFSSFEGTVQDRDLVESYLPIRQGGGAVEAVFELYTDVTPLMAGIERSTASVFVGFILLFGPLYGFLFLIVRRADRTITGQYAAITEKTEALEREVAERKLVEEALKEARDELELRVEERTRELREEIAERRRAEGEARRHRHELAHFGRVSLMGEMVTSLAHELNQPLTVISGCAQLCQQKLGAGEGERAGLLDAVGQVSEQADRANEIIRRVRGFLRKNGPERRTVDINDAIDGVADLLRYDAREHGVALRLDLAQALPPVAADPIQIQQVIVNLAHNGMEAMSGAPAAELTVSTSRRADGAVEVAIRDHGPGIPAESLDRVFDPFFTTKREGLGMGLSICRSIVEAHGGRLWATAADGRGTVFHFTLPVAEAGARDGE